MPTGSDETDALAMPEGVSGTTARTWLPRSNVIVPTVTGAPAAVTDAVNVTS